MIAIASASLTSVPLSLFASGLVAFLSLGLEGEDALVDMCSASLVGCCTAPVLLDDDVDRCTCDWPDPVETTVAVRVASAWGDDGRGDSKTLC